jgi:hypothetical protein
VPLLSRRGAEPRRTEAVLQQGCGRRARWRAGGAAAERGGPADGVAASGGAVPPRPSLPVAASPFLHFPFSFSPLLFPSLFNFGVVAVDLAGGG